MSENLYCSSHKSSNKKYREAWTRIFKKEKKDNEEQLQDDKKDN